MSILGPIITGIGSLLGGAMGGHDSQKGRSRSKTKTRQTATTTNRLRLGALVRTAERNGFNPLTLLRAGGIGAFTDSTTSGKSTSRSRSRSRGSSSSTTPMAAGISGAMQSFGGALDSAANSMAADPAQSAAAAWQEPVAAGPISLAPQARAAEMDLINRQLASVDYGELGTQPRQFSQKVENKEKADLASFKDKRSNENTNPYPRNMGWETNPNFVDADDWESRYSDIGGWAGGAINVLADGIHNMKPGFDKAYNDVKPSIDRATQAYGDYLMRKNTSAPESSNIWDPASLTVTDPSYIEFQRNSPLDVGDPLKKQYYEWTRGRGTW